MSRHRATLIGFAAILLWALLALFTILSAPVPPLLLNAMCFAIGGGVGLVWTLARGRIGVLRGISWRVYAFGTLGLFGAHLLYFTAFRLAPAAETGLIAYLWPLLIVLLSGLLPGERLGGLHVLGGLLAFSGAALMVLRADIGGSPDAFRGYAVAFVFALTWAGYSVLSRRLGAIPTESVTVFCLASALCSAIAHLALEEPLWPTDATGWLAVLGLGLGPVGIAFFFWDVGMKKGDIQLLGTASYAAPLLSTLALMLAGSAEPSLRLAFAAILITAGAALAAYAGRRATRPAGEVTPG